MPGTLWSLFLSSCHQHQIDHDSCFLEPLIPSLLERKSESQSGQELGEHSLTDWAWEKPGAQPLRLSYGLTVSPQNSQDGIIALKVISLDRVALGVVIKP